MKSLARTVIGTAAVLSLLMFGPAAGAEHGVPGTTQLISRPSGLAAVPAPVTGDSYLSEDLYASSETTQRAVSGDGTKIVFASEADGLSTADDNHYRNIFVYDTTTSTATLVSRASGDGAAANADSYEPTISKDGNQVAFVSLANNLDSAITNKGFREVYVRDLTAKTTKLVSCCDSATKYAQSDQPSVSVDTAGKVRVAFASYAKFSSDDTNSSRDVYVRNVTDGTTTLASRADGATGLVGNGFSQDPSISADGTAVAFDSASTNFISPADTNGSNRDVFVRVLSGTGADSTVLVDRKSDSGGIAGAQASFASAVPSISDDGTKIAFASQATNLDAADTSSGGDTYVRDLTAGTTTLVSRANGASGSADNLGDLSHAPAISGDGTKVVFNTLGADLESPGVPDGSSWQVLERDLAGGTTKLVSRASDSGVTPGAAGDSYALNPSVSTDGKYVVFDSRSTNLAGGDDDDFRQVFLRDVVGGTTTNVSRPNASAFVGPGVGNADSIYPAGVSADGRYVLFTSGADWLSPDEDSRFLNVFVRDTVTDTTTLVSRASGPNGAPANADSEAGGISADGRRVVFVSSATNLAGMTCTEYYVRDLVTNQTTYVGPTPEQCTGLATIDSYGRSYAADALISGDGTKVAFATSAGIDVSDTVPGTIDVYEEDLATGTIKLVDRADGPAGAIASSGYSNLTGINADGSRVVFETASANLDPSATVQQVFIRDLSTSHTVLVSRTSSGDPVSGPSYGGGISADGTRVAFMSSSAAVTPDSLYSDGVYVRDLAAGTTTLASRADGPAGVQALGVDTASVLPPSISADGKRVTFVTDAGNLGVGYANSGSEVYVRDLAGNTTTLVSHQAGDSNLTADLASQHATISGNGDCVAFVSRADDLIPSYTGGTDFQNVYLGTVSRECPAVPPDTTLVSGPTGAVATRLPTFTFAKDDATAHFECKLDAGGFAACSSPYVTPPLADGSHTFTVRAVDPAGYADPTPPSRTFKVDATPPETTIVSAPSGLVRTRGASFAFRATEAATFKCSLDGAPALACTSPRSYNGLADGSHTFTVVATDGVGNRDASPAARGWKVDARAPGPSLSVSSKQKLGAVLRKGLRLKLGSTETSTYALTVDIPGPKLFGKRSGGLAAGQALVTVRALPGAKKALAKKRSATLLIRFIVVDSAGNPSPVVTRRIKLKR